MPEAIKEENKKSSFTYDDFDLGVYKEEKNSMEDFRRNYEWLWKKLQEMYLPASFDQADWIRMKYTIDSSTGLAVPDTILGNVDDDENMRFSEPLVAIKVHTALSLLTQRTPDVKWDSDDAKYDDLVPVLNALRRDDWDNSEVRSQYTMLWFNKILYGSAGWRRFFSKVSREAYFPKKIDFKNQTVDYEKTEVIEFDGTLAEAMSPFEFWIDPNTRPFRPSSMRKVMWMKEYDFEKFVDVFKEYKGEKWLRDNVTPSVKENGNTKVVKCFYYENIDLDLLFIATENDVELVKEHLPQNHKMLSVMLDIWMPRGSEDPYGLGPIEMLAEDKKALDEFKSMTMTQVKFSIQKAMFYTGSFQSEGGDNGAIRIRSDRAYKVTDKPTFMEVPGPGKDSWDAMTSLRDRIDDASGINRPLGGEIVKTTAFQTDLAKDAALARLSVPIASTVWLLERDAELTFELQKQYLTLPKVKQLVSAEEISHAMVELQAIKDRGESPAFDIFVDENNYDEEGKQIVKVFRGDYRTLQLNVEKNPMGAYIPSTRKSSVVLTPELMDWRGKIRVVSDSVLSITPTVDKVRKLEMYNLLIPMFGKPAQLVAKPAHEIVKLYGEDPDDVLPEDFLNYLKQLKSGPRTPNTITPNALAKPPIQPGMEQGGGNQEGALNFQQEAAPTVVTNMGGQKDLISAQSERLGG